MPHINVISEADAKGPLAALYERLVAPDGTVANVLKIQSLSPKTLETHYAFYRSLMFGKGPLQRYQRELIAVAVSCANRCHY